MKLTRTALVLVLVFILSAVGAEDLGLRAQHEKKLWVTYRSFNKELERTGQFAAMGITNRCFFAANTINVMGNPYRNPAVRERIAALKKVQDALPDAPSVAQVLLVADPDSLYYLNERNPAERAFGESVRNALARTGAPYDACSFGDLAALDLSRYRLILLNSTLLITPERERLLKERVRLRPRLSSLYAREAGGTRDTCWRAPLCRCLHARLRESQFSCSSHA